MTERDRWLSATWLLRGRLARLAAEDVGADLTPYRRLLATLRELGAEAPPVVLGLIDEMEFKIREREEIQARADRVRYDQ